MTSWTKCLSVGICQSIGMALVWLNFGREAGISSLRSSISTRTTNPLPRKLNFGAAHGRGIDWRAGSFLLKHLMANQSAELFSIKRFPFEQFRSHSFQLLTM